MSTQRHNYNGVCVGACACVYVKPCLFRYDEMRARRLQLVQTTEGPVPLEGGNDASACQKKKKPSHGAEEEKNTLPEMILTSGGGSRFHLLQTLPSGRPFLIWFHSLFFRSPVRRWWWSAKLKTPWPTWLAGWCPTDTITITTTTITTARAASRTACRLGFLTAGRNFWTSPRSSCSTPRSTHRGRCSPWREAAGFHGKQATQSECRYPLNQKQAF